MPETFDLDLEPLPAGGLDRLARHLADASLPHENLDGTTKRFFCASVDGITVGYVGLEISGADALLRSAVIFMRARGQGYGRAMVQKLLIAADDLCIRRVWLLTTSAPGFFNKLSFRQVARTAAPAAIARSEEFRSACPASAVCMVRDVQVRPQMGQKMGTDH